MMDIDEKFDEKSFIKFIRGFTLSWQAEQIRGYFSLVENFVTTYGDEIVNRFNGAFFYPVFREPSATESRSSWIKWLIKCAGEYTGNFPKTEVDQLRAGIPVYLNTSETGSTVSPVEFCGLMEHLVSEHGIDIVEDFLVHLKKYCVESEDTGEDSEVEEWKLKLETPIDAAIGEEEEISALQLNCMLNDFEEKGVSEEMEELLAQMRVPGSVRILESRFFSRESLKLYFQSVVLKEQYADSLELLGKLTNTGKKEDDADNEKPEENPEGEQEKAETSEAVEESNSEATEKTTGTENITNKNGDDDANVTMEATSHVKEAENRADIETAALESIAALDRFQISSISSVCQKAIEIIGKAFDEIYAEKTHKGKIAFVETISNDVSEGEKLASSTKLLRCIAASNKEDSNEYGCTLAGDGDDSEFVNCSPDMLSEKQSEKKNYVAAQLKDQSSTPIGVIGFNVELEEHPSKDADVLLLTVIYIL